MREPMTEAAGEKPSGVFFTQSFPPETYVGANRARCLVDALLRNQPILSRIDAGANSGWYPTVPVLTKHSVAAEVSLLSRPHPRQFAIPDAVADPKPCICQVLRAGRMPPLATRPSRCQVREIGVLAETTHNDWHGYPRTLPRVHARTGE